MKYALTTALLRKQKRWRCAWSYSSKAYVNISKLSPGSIQCSHPTNFSNFRNKSRTQFAQARRLGGKKKKLCFDCWIISTTYKSIRSLTLNKLSKEMSPTSLWQNRFYTLSYSYYNSWTNKLTMVCWVFPTKCKNNGRPTKHCQGLWIGCQWKQLIDIQRVSYSLSYHTQRPLLRSLSVGPSLRHIFTNLLPSQKPSTWCRPLLNHVHQRSISLLYQGQNSSQKSVCLSLQRHRRCRQCYTPIFGWRIEFGRRRRRRRRSTRFQ